MSKETQQWTWEYAVQRPDGTVRVSAQPEYPWRMHEAKQYADNQNHAANQIGRLDLATAKVIRRKRWVRTIHWHEGWENIP